MLPSAASTLPSFEAPTFVRFLTFLYLVLSLSYFHTSLSAIFHTSLSPFFFISSCAFLYYLSFLLPDEVCGRNVVNSTVCWCSVYCSLNSCTSILFVLHKCRNLFSVAPFGAVIVVFSACVRAAFCCSTLPSVEAPMFVRFLAFLYCVLSLSFFSHFAVCYFSYFAFTFF